MPGLSSTISPVRGASAGMMSLPGSPRTGEIVLDKPGKGAFYATPLDALLREARIIQLVFMGVTTEVCVQTTMREANDRGYDSLLLEDCTESYFPEFKAATLEMVAAQGAIVGWTATSGALLAALASGGVVVHG